jgi:uncharacterized protein (TIGR03067 family)
MRITTAGLVAALTVGTLMAASLAGQAGPGEKADAERILGPWRLAQARGDGNDMPQDLRELARLVFTKGGNAALTIAGEGKEDGQYKILGAGQMDLNMGDRKDKDLSPCIFKFEGNDRLWLCFNDNPQNDKRPMEFNGDQGTSQVLFVLERVKAGEEKPTAQEMAKHKDLVEKITEAPARMQSINNLSQIGRAIYFYYDVNGHLPVHAIYGKDGKTALLSWRVAILPQLDQEALYKEFILDQPWDSPHNRKLVAKIPNVFAPVGLGKKEEGLTYYQVFTGPNLIFDGTNKVRFSDIRDGPANTILVVEANDPVIWTRPADLKLVKEMDKMPAVGGLFKDRTHVLFCDAHVDFLTRKVPPSVLQALVTPNGGEKVNLQEWK